jgi:hypothetical protein
MVLGGSVQDQDWLRGFPCNTTPLIWVRMVVHTCNPTSSGGRDRRMGAQGQKRQKLVRLYLKNKLDVVAHACNLSYSGDRGRRIMF